MKFNGNPDNFLLTFPQKIGYNKTRTEHFKHCAVLIGNDTQARQLITKGDANALPDVDPVSYERVVGKVVMCIPVLGTVSEMLHSGPGVTACVAIFALAIILWTLADKIKKESFK